METSGAHPPTTPGARPRVRRSITKRSGTIVKLFQRRSEIAKLRASGLTIEAISIRVGCSRETVRKGIDFVLQNYREIIAQNTPELRAHALARIHALRQAHWEAAISGNDYNAAELMIKLEKREADLLGLDMPTKFAATDPTGSEAIIPELGHNTTVEIVIFELPDNKRMGPEEGAIIEHDGPAKTANGDGRGHIVNGAI